MASHLLDRYSTTALYRFVKKKKPYLLTKSGKKIFNSRSAWATKEREGGGGQNVYFGFVVLETE